MEGVPGATLGGRLTGVYKGKPPKGSVKSEREKASRDNIYQIMMVFQPKAGLNPLTPAGPVCQSAEDFPNPKISRQSAFSPENRPKNRPGPGTSAEIPVPGIAPKLSKTGPESLKIGLPAAPIGAEPPRPGPRRRPGPGPGLNRRGRAGRRPWWPPTVPGGPSWGRQPSCGPSWGRRPSCGPSWGRRPSCGPSWGRRPTKD